MTYDPKFYLVFIEKYIKVQEERWCSGVVNKITDLILLYLTKESCRVFNFNQTKFTIKDLGFRKWVL